MSNNYLMFKPATDYDTVSVIIEEVKQLHIIADILMKILHLRQVFL